MQSGNILEVARKPIYLEPREGDIRNSLADISLAKNFLGYEPATKFDTGLIKTIEFFKTGIQKQHLRSIFKIQNMPFVKTDFPGLQVFIPVIFEDKRGYFFESYNQKLFSDEGIEINFVQDNQASSSFGVIRGLHYQLEPHAQTKLIRVLSGTYS